MVKGKRGFTLIELLIVVAVIGILAAILIPNALASIQKTNQKQTMRNIVSIATACASYITEAGYAVDSMNDFTNDLINMNGSWLHAPRISYTGS